MFEADMVTPCGLDCNICSQALIENDPYKSCKQVIEAVVIMMTAYFFEISNHFCKRVALVTNPKTLTIVSRILADYNQNQR